MLVTLPVSTASNLSLFIYRMDTMNFPEHRIHTAAAERGELLLERIPGFFAVEMGIDEDRRFRLVAVEDMVLRGMDEAIKMMPSLPLPDAAKGDKSKAGLKLMKWIAEPSRTLPDYAKNIVRPADKIPAGIHNKRTTRTASPPNLMETGKLELIISLTESPIF